ncbi:hypothetical protein [uncultured Tenacibaculum sp.]|uniref:hypothetical protein n=1 Tax=uncultured Tenacibaculum sp. TaxID=174713 RepID=UPI0026078DA8|nr:hypothetical protein [uncultured Tenacibaculum sp.]
MKKSILNLGKALSKESQQQIKGGKLEIGSGVAKWVWCKCHDGQKYFVGASTFQNKVDAYVKQCQNDGGEPIIETTYF